MYATNTRTKIAALFCAVVMSFTVLGGTVAAMQADSFSNNEVVTLDRMIVSTPAQSAVN
jgi:hypothetical protein